MADEAKPATTSAVRDADGTFTKAYLAARAVTKRRKKRRKLLNG
jgi:hypothetical protein